ncbi:hypothetical protein BDN70DRAFT_586885 [Pholiota conissans]|uniref:Uncharacterized protein n=1 Tax=Pholiota conissans TaxID=109636 RepID=A0A9P5YK22_9AGAR|nr:hypothetical protein BDN70DRAFT_586885 [Pholiota conissans]
MNHIYPYQLMIHPRICRLILQCSLREKVCFDLFQPSPSELQFDLFFSAYQSPRVQFVQVWQVALKFGDEHQPDRLSALLLSSFPREDCGTLDSLSIHGQYIAFGIERHSDPEMYSYVSTVNWSEADHMNRLPTHSLAYPRKIITCFKSPDDIRLLPGERVSVFAGKAINIYDLSAIKQTSTIPPLLISRRPIYTPPIWTDSTHVRCKSLSRVYSSPQSDTIRLTGVSRNGVWGLILILPLDGVKPKPKFVKLMDVILPNVTRYLSGYNNAVIHGRTPRLEVLNFSWLDDISNFSNHLTAQLDGEFGTQYMSAFDETSGRVAIIEQGELVVFDF